MLGGAAIVGFGMGFTMQTVLLVAQNEVELRDIGVATSTSFLARQMGGTIALAALGGLLNNRLALLDPAAHARGRQPRPRDAARHSREDPPSSRPRSPTA